MAVLPIIPPHRQRCIRWDKMNRAANSRDGEVCRHPNRKSDPTLVPLIFNNTTPAKVTYTVTTFDMAVLPIIPPHRQRCIRWDKMNRAANSRDGEDADGALRNLFVRTMSTDEHSVRLTSIMGSEKERLGESLSRAG
jgi:hypothetical protein